MSSPDLARTVSADDKKFDSALRPKSLSDFAGQSRVTDNLRVAIDAALLRSEPIDHIILYGAPGLGKTTLSYVVANEMRAAVTQTTGPALTKFKHIYALVKEVMFQQVVFIDEIHRMPNELAEVLYTVMEDFVLHWTSGQYSTSKPLKHFTVIGATTRPGMITAPLRDRFGLQLQLELYGVNELQKIVARSAGLLNSPITDQASMEIARRARGTPRVANRLLRRARDYAQLYGNGTIDSAAARESMELMGIDHLGLDESDHRILRLLVEKYKGKPVGLSTLAGVIGRRHGNDRGCE